MTHASVRAAIETYLSTNWATTPIAWENVDFTPPSDGQFVSLEVFPGEGEIASIGTAPTHRFKGEAVVTCYTHKGVGAAPSLSLADQVSALFRDQSIGGATFRAAKIELDGTDADSFRALVTIPFWWDQEG